VLWGEDCLSHIVLRKRDEAVGLAQVAVVKAPLIRAGTALVFWGPLWRRRDREIRPEVFSLLIDTLRDEYVEKRGMLLRVIPNELNRDKDRVRAVLENAGYQSKGRFYKTYLLDITHSPDYLRKQLKQKWRNCLNRAESEELTIAEGTGPEIYNTFHEIFREMQKRKQFNDISIDPGTFLEIQKDLPPELKARIFVCKKLNDPLAGAVISVMGDTAILLLAASNDRGRKVMASYLLQWRLIEWLQMKGFRFYDMGGVSPSHPQVNHFKAGLGGEAVSHSGLFEQCSNPASALFDRSLGIMKTFKNRLKNTVRTVGHSS
jgi:hypothetical protein